MIDEDDSHDHDSQSLCGSSLSCDGSLSRAAIEQRDYELAKKLQEEENRMQYEQEGTEDTEENEISGNTRSGRISHYLFTPQEQPLTNSDQEMCNDELSPTLLNCEGSDPVDSDDYTGSEMSEQSSAGEHTESGAEMSDESEVRFAEGEDNGDEDEFDRERNVENGVITFVPRSEMEAVPSPQSESEDEESLESDSISRRLQFDQNLMHLLIRNEMQRQYSLEPEYPVLVSADDDEPDDTVVRSEEFGRCTICFEDIPYDPVGCLYCQQMIGCRRCVKRWYGCGRSVNVIDLGFLDGHQPDNHRQCPLCRHEWLDQMEVTSMFDLRND